MNYYNRHLSDILDIFRTFIGHMKIPGSSNIKGKAVRKICMEIMASGSS